jgi:hypothetical protein
MQDPQFMKTFTLNLVPLLSLRHRLKRLPTKSAIHLLLVISALLYPVAQVRSQPVVHFGQFTLGGGFNGPDQVQGWEFVPQVNVTVLKLGLYDGSSTGGFQQPHAVAIWDGNGDLITSASIPQGVSAPLQDNFRYVDIPSTLLFSGETYVVGAFMPAPVTDYTVLWGRDALTSGIVSFDSRVEFVAYRAGLSPGAISFPQSRWVEYVGGFGPNFVIAVPEPSTFALLSVMLLASVLWVLQMRRSKNAA